jgi:GT2 family glycosyltransferase
MKEAIVITLMDDPRVFDTVDSLLDQEKRPNRIFIADASKDNKIYNKLKKYKKPVEVHKIFGSVGESRNQTLPLIDEEVIAFIDSDETAKKDWLEKITKPIVDESADYAGGKCVPMYTPKTKVDRYVWEKEEALFKKYDQLSFQMGNTAWHRKVFDTIGNFDNRIIWGGEDYDINIRATQAGYIGKYIPEAVLYHDQGMKTLEKWAQKRYKYHTGSTVAYLKNNIDIKRKERTVSIGIHPLDHLDLLLKVFAFIRGNILWKKIK